MTKQLFFLATLLIGINAKSQSDIKIEKDFSGPINSVFGGSKEVWIYPTCDKDTEVLTNLKNYVTEMYEAFSSKGSMLIPDSLAITMPLSEYALIVYGTIESNLFLKKIKPSLPFKIENNIIYADKEYSDEKLKFITCLPNPQNPKKGMAIYTGISNRYIIDINRVFHGPTDYIISINLNKDNLNKGFYSKTDGKWKFVK